MPLPLAALIAAAATLAIAYLDVSVRLGAHPIWAGQTAWIGVALGLALAGTAHWLRAPRLAAMIASLVVLGAAYGLATYGKGAFAASFAEDRLAGTFWYYGWIGTAAGFAAAVTAGLTRRRAITPE